MSNEGLANTSLRQRFEISAGNAPQASRFIAKAVEAGMIKQANPENKSRKLTQGPRFWT